MEGVEREGKVEGLLSSEELLSGLFPLHLPLVDCVHVSTAAIGTSPLTTPLKVHTSIWAWHLTVWVWPWFRVLYSITREILSQGKQSAMHEGGTTRQE